MILQGDALTKLKELSNESVQCVFTSPPYWSLRDYGVEGQLGLEKTFEEYIIKLVAIFDEVKRVLKKDGVCFVNMGDTYAGTVKKNKNEYGKNSKIAKNFKMNWMGSKGQSVKDKCLCQIPPRFSIAMTDRGWILRNRCIWFKPNAMPSSAKDRFTVDYEDVFFFVKEKRYYFDSISIMEDSIWYFKDKRAATGGITRKGKSVTEEGLQYQINKSGSFSKIKGKRHKRSVWKIPAKPYKGSRFSAFPEELVEPCVQAGSRPGDVILDPFAGSGTTLAVCKRLKRDFIGIELNKEYIPLIRERLRAVDMCTPIP